MPSPKRPKIRGREAAAAAAVDGISELPDSILVHILSLLPIEDAIKTEVLSKRWQFLWTYVPSLVFRFRYSEEDDYDDDAEAEAARNDAFVSFVEKTLFLSNCSKIKKFGVDFHYEPRFAPNVNSWTRFAAGKGTEELHLEFQYFLEENIRYELPQLLYTNSYFKALRFSLCKFVPKGVVAWNSLKRLSIGYSNLSENVIEKILSGSPVLETLEFYQYYGFSRLHIGNASVKKLILRDFYGEDEADGGSEEDEAGGEDDPEAEGLEISAPYLLSLEISGHLARNCRLTNVSSLVDATLNCILSCSVDGTEDNFERIQSDLRGLLESLAHVKSFTLGAWAIEVLSFMEAKGLSSPPLKCECLTLDTRISKFVLPGISSILKSSHNLETLFLTVSSRAEITYFDFKLPELCNLKKDQYWTSQKGTFKCLRLQLKNVNISSARLCHLCDSTYFSFVQFLLSNARVLQRMVISTPRGDRERLMEILRGAQKLLSFPRSSPDAQVMFY